MIDQQSDSLQALKQLRHLNGILQALRNINQLIVREKDRQQLIQKTCDILVEMHGYHAAWIVLNTADGSLEHTAQNGFNKRFSEFTQRLRQGEKVFCMQPVSGRGKVTAIRHTHAQCADCPLKDEYGKNGALAVELRHGKRHFGWLSAAVEEHHVDEAEGHVLLAEIAGDLAFALHSLDKERMEEQARQTVMEKERRFRVLFDSIPDAVFIYPWADKKSATFIEVNEAACKGYGYSKKEFLNMPPARICALTPDSQAKKILKRKGHVLYETVHIGKDGRRFPVEVRSTLIDYGSVRSVLSVARDISARKKAEEENRLFKKIIETTTQSVILADMEGTVLYVNDSYLTLSGFALKEVLGRSIFQFTDDWGTVVLKKRVIPALLSWGNWWGEMRILKKDGLFMLAEINCSLLTDEQNQPQYFVAVFSDITVRKQAQEEVQKLSRVIETTSQATVIASAGGQIVYVNNGLLTTLGYDNKDEILGKSIFDFTDEEGRRLLSEEIFPSLISSGHWRGEIQNKRKDGSLFPAEETCSVIKNEQGQPEYFVAVFVDITERKLAEIRLRESEERFRLAFQTNPDAANISRLKDGRYVDINRGFTEVTGYERDEVIGKTALDINIWVDPAERKLLVERLIKNGSVTNFQARFRLKDGTIATGLISASLIRLQGEAHVIFLTRNIEEIKQAQEALRKSEYILSEAQRIAHIGSWELNLQTNTLHWSDEIYRLFELPKERFGASYEAFLNVVHPDDREMVDRAYKQSVKEHTPYNIEHRLLLADGRIKWMHEQGETVYDASGQPLRTIGTVMDITEKKLAHIALHDSEERYRYLFENSPVALWEEDLTEMIAYLNTLLKQRVKKGDLRTFLERHPQELKEFIRRIHIVDINQATVRFHHADNKQQLVENLEKLFTEDSYEILKEELLAIAAGKDVFAGEERVKTLTGEIKDIYLRFSLKRPTSAKNRYIGLVATVDVTPLKQARRELQESLDELRQIYRLSQRIGNSRSARQVAEESLKVIYEALKPDTALFYLRKNEELELLAHRTGTTGFNVKEAFLHHVGECLCGIAARSGVAIFSRDINTDLRCTLNECKNAGLQSFASLPLLAGRTVIGLIGLGSLKTRDFASQKSFLETLSNEAAVGLQNALLLEELRRHEKELEQRVDERTAQLIQANRELEAFSYSVSHDLRAPLRAIDGFSRILSEDYVDKLDTEAKRLIGVVRENTQRMGRLIDDLLNFSRISRQDIKPSQVDLANLAESIYYELTNETQRKKIRFRVKKLPVAQADAALIRQVFYNLLSNALKFSSGRKIPEIEVGAMENERQVTYYIKDNGVGFDMKYAGKLFQIFQRLHSNEEFAGTGIGLSIVQRIIARHGGRVWAEAQEGEGATFYFTLQKNN